MKNASTAGSCGRKMGEKGDDGIPLSLTEECCRDGEGERKALQVVFGL